MNPPTADQNRYAFSSDQSNSRAGLAIVNFYKYPTISSLLMAIDEVSKNAVVLRQLNFPIDQYMDYFMQFCIRIPAAYLLSRNLKLHMGLLILRFVKYCARESLIRQMRARTWRSSFLALLGAARLAIKRKACEQLSEPKRFCHNNRDGNPVYNPSQSLINIQPYYDQNPISNTNIVNHSMNPSTPMMMPDVPQNRNTQRDYSLELELIDTIERSIKLLTEVFEGETEGMDQGEPNVNDRQEANITVSLSDTSSSESDDEELAAVGPRPELTPLGGGLTITVPRGRSPLLNSPIVLETCSQGQATGAPKPESSIDSSSTCDYTETDSSSDSSDSLELRPNNALDSTNLTGGGQAFDDHAQPIQVLANAHALPQSRVRAQERAQERAKARAQARARFQARALRKRRIRQAAERKAEAKAMSEKLANGPWPPGLTYGRLLLESRKRKESMAETQDLALAYGGHLARVKKTFAEMRTQLVPTSPKFQMTQSEFDSISRKNTKRYVTSRLAVVKRRLEAPCSSGLAMRLHAERVQLSRKLANMCGGIRVVPDPPKPPPSSTATVGSSSLLSDTLEHMSLNAKKKPADENADHLDGKRAKPNNDSPFDSGYMDGTAAQLPEPHRTDIPQTGATLRLNGAAAQAGAVTRIATGNASNMINYKVSRQMAHNLLQTRMVCIQSRLELPCTSREARSLNEELRSVEEKINVIETDMGTMNDSDMEVVVTLSDNETDDSSVYEPPSTATSTTTVNESGFLESTRLDFTMTSSANEDTTPHQLQEQQEQNELSYSIVEPQLQSEDSDSESFASVSDYDDDNDADEEDTMPSP
ncbi:hypothetical protein AWZ03_014500 [Drosophila navojoa]|uniref:Uncharacterized protein n=1 Tax=Drosophila navojoa TaxID=7232 RepID=A0A484ARS8_DRONA|nr:hypothetical protein AWZ03_014500 [Drosophila navojoa]